AGALRPAAAPLGARAARASAPEEGADALEQLAGGLVGALLAGDRRLEGEALSEFELALGEQLAHPLLEVGAALQQLLERLVLDDEQLAGAHGLDAGRARLAGQQ